MKNLDNRCQNKLNKVENETESRVTTNILV